MDRKALEAQMREHFEKRLPSMINAVEQAPDGQWIAASEWEVRAQFQALAAECYQAALQARLETLPSAKQAAFSPSRPAGGGLAQQRAPRDRGAHGQR